MIWYIIAGLIGFITGIFLAAISFALTLAKNGYAMKDGKIKPIRFTPSNLIVNFPEGMTDERAEEMLTDFAAKIRGEPGGMSVAELDERIAHMIEDLTGAC